MDTVTRTSAAILDTIVSALRRGDTARAEAALAEGKADGEAMLRLAELNFRRQRWFDAAWLFDHVPGVLAPERAFKRNLSRNLASLAVHRPEVCRLLSSLPPTDAVSIARSGTGHPTIAVRQSDGSFGGLSADDRPLAAAEAALQRVAPALARGLAIGLAGIGDGYLLYRLAHDPTKLFLGMQGTIFVIEPDPHIALHAMMIHDYSGTSGPIEQERFHWFVGPSWSAGLRATTERDLYLGTSSLTVSFTAAGPAIRQELHQISQELAERDTATTRRVAELYAGHDPAAFARLLTPNASRRPRVLLLTTRFSTVLQYSTRDTAAAFERLGWDAHVLMEPTAAHRLYQQAIRRTVEQIAPDLVFQIDHLRHEHGDLFPKNLPFVCWAQDHLPHLTTAGVGSHVGPTDFVLTDTADTYEQKYDYPRRQLLALPKLTRSATAQARSSVGGGPDLVFVSNASRRPERLLAELCAGTVDPTLQQLLKACGEQMIGVYAAGGSLGTYFGDILPLIHSTAAKLEMALTRDQVDYAARVLCHPLNDALYRQQALKWAATAAVDLGLQMELYGTGWEQHPDLAPYAKGPIAYDVLADLTCRARINLQIVPYLCLHQRLLDGVMAGGFFLIRRHTADVDPGRLLSFLSSEGVSHCRDTAEVSAALPPTAQRVFGRLARAARPAMCTTGREDVVRMVRQWHEAGQLEPHAGPLPRFDEVSFDSAKSLQAQLERFVSNSSLRHEVVREQQENIDRRLTYDAGMARIVSQMATLLTATNHVSTVTGVTDREAA